MVARLYLGLLCGGFLPTVLTFFERPVIRSRENSVRTVGGEVAVLSATEQGRPL